MCSLSRLLDLADEEEDDELAAVVVVAFDAPVMVVEVDDFVVKVRVNMLRVGVGVRVCCDDEPVELATAAADVAELNAPAAEAVEFC